MNTAMLIKPKSTVFYIYSDLSVEEGFRDFVEKGFSAVPVIDRDGMYIGVVSERTFLYRIIDSGSSELSEWEGITMGEIATDDRFEAVSIDTDVDTLFERIVSQNFVPVVDSRGMFSGIVTRRAVLLRMKQKIH